MKTVFKGEHYQVMNAKNILLDNDIEVFVENELMGSIRPWGVTAGGFNPIQLKVYEADVEKATALLKFLEE
ncbi:MAG: DUF2007 domain-containing protein [Cellulophaga sp.]|nr:DUF2007 domain-containing protein [Cellulophaga sp.]